MSACCLSSRTKRRYSRSGAPLTTISLGSFWLTLKTAFLIFASRTSFWERVLVPRARLARMPRLLGREMKLTGITGGAKPSATINNLTFAVGEEQEVKFEGRKFRIRVLEIGVKSVLVSVEKQSEPVELRLRDTELKLNE